MFGTGGAISFEISAVSDSERTSDEAANEGTADKENNKTEANITAKTLFNIKIISPSLHTRMCKTYNKFKSYILKRNEQKEKDLLLIAE